MASTSHANAFRPTSLDQVLGQIRHVKSLKFFLKKNKLPPVILISGKSGTGKTTTARIVAAAAMCPDFNPETVTACGECVNCRSAAGINDGPNFMHLDGGGSNLKDVVENDLKQFLYSSPVKARYKVCIADEAQALSIGARNSLLTLAENLPKSALIIMTTTDPEAIDSAILTRALKYHFAPLTPEQMIEGVVKHNPELDTPESCEALTTLAGFADGSMREFWQLIQQWESYEEPLTPDLAAEIVGGAKAKDRTALWEAVEGGDFAGIQKTWKQMVSAGANPQRLGGQLMTDLYRRSAEKPLARDWPQAIRLLAQAQVYKEELGYISALMSIAKSPAEQVHSLTVEDLTDRVSQRVVDDVARQTVEILAERGMLTPGENLFGRDGSFNEAVAKTRPSDAEIKKICNESADRVDAKLAAATKTEDDKFAKAMGEPTAGSPDSELYQKSLAERAQRVENLVSKQVVDVDEMELPATCGEHDTHNIACEACAALEVERQFPSPPWEPVVINLDEPEAVYKYVFENDD